MSYHRFVPLLLALCFCDVANSADAQSQKAGSLGNSAWRVYCDKCNRETTGSDFSPYYMILRKDGSVGYSFSKPTDYDFASYPAKWRIDSGKLVVEWKHGDVQKYSVNAPLKGLNQNGLEQRIERVKN